MPEPATRRNLLIITYSFPPFGGVGVHRALSLARYLPTFGWNVDVLTAKNPSAVGTDARLLEQVPASVTVHRTFTLDLPFGLKKAIKRLVGGSRHKVESAAGTQQSRKGLFSAAAQFAKDVLSPDPQVLWLPFAVRAAARIVSERRIDVVLVTVPPFSSLRIGVALKKRYPHITVISDLRDEWLTYYFHTLGYNRSPRALAGAVRIERECVESSSRVVTVTERARMEMLRRYPNQPSEKFLVVGNGYEPEIFRDFTPRPNLTGTILLGYTGTVYAPSDPTTFVGALSLLPEALRSRMRIRFIGHVENPEYRTMLEQHAPVVQLDGFLPQAVAMGALESVDFLLLIWNDCINIPGKLYDYLATGKPIVAFADPDGEVWQMIAATRTGWCADYRSPERIAALLTEVAENREQMLAGFAPNPEAVKRCQRERRAEAYSEALEFALRDQTPIQVLATAEKS
jgi:glycosyltransferase involved in cell wall biosynthesis